MTSDLVAPDLFPGRLFHVGVVVDDLAAGMQEWTTRFGVTWREPSAGTVDVRTEGVTSSQPFQAVFSQSGPVQVEMLPSRPGSIWARCGLHHLGYWSVDVDAEARAMVDSGAVLEASLLRSGRVVAAYLLSGPVRVELNDEGARARISGGPDNGAPAKGSA